MRDGFCSDCGTRKTALVLLPRYGTLVPVCKDRAACAERMEDERVETFTTACMADFRLRSHETRTPMSALDALLGRL